MNHSITDSGDHCLLNRHVLFSVVLLAQEDEIPSNLGT